MAVGAVRRVNRRGLHDITKRARCWPMSLLRRATAETTANRDRIAREAGAEGPEAAEGCRATATRVWPTAIIVVTVDRGQRKGDGVRLLKSFGGTAAPVWGASASWALAPAVEGVRRVQEATRRMKAG